MFLATMRRISNGGSRERALYSAMLVACVEGQARDFPRALVLRGIHSEITRILILKMRQSAQDTPRNNVQILLIFPIRVWCSLMHALGPRVHTATLRRARVTGLPARSSNDTVLAGLFIERTENER